MSRKSSLLAVFFVAFEVVGDPWLESFVDGHSSVSVVVCVIAMRILSFTTSLLQKEYGLLVYAIILQWTTNEKLLRSDTPYPEGLIRRIQEVRYAVSRRSDTPYLGAYAKQPRYAVLSSNMPQRGPKKWHDQWENSSNLYTPLYAFGTIFRELPYPFDYPMRRLTMEEILAKFIDEGRREHEEMEIFIKEFRTTNELLLKTRSNLLSELKIEVNELSKVVSNVLIPKNKVKGVTTRGGKMTSEATRSKEINETGINKNEPPRFEQDVQEKPHDDGVENKSSSILEKAAHPLNLKPLDTNIPFIEALFQITKYAKYMKSLLTNKSRLEEACTETINERCLAALLNELPLKEKDPGSFTIPFQVLDKHKETKDLAADHSSRLENPHIEVLTEREIADEFFDKHLIALKSKSNNDEPWYADFEEPYAFKLRTDNIMRRCVDGSETLEILAHCHSGPTGGHHSPNITAKKVYESGFYWPSVFKDANEYVRRCDACQRSGNISSRNEMPQNNIQVCEVFDVWGLDFMGPFPQSRGNKYILVAVDYVSKWVEAQALPTNDARVVVKFLRQLFARFGVPKALISDRGTHFCNSQLEKALQRYGVTHKLSTAYHPQSNGQTEVTNNFLLWGICPPYISRLFLLVISKTLPHLDNGIYNAVDRVMRPLALKQTRKPQSDRGKARHSVSSTFAHHNRGSSFHQGDDDEDDYNAFARFNTIITSLKALDEGFSSKNYVRKFLRALHPKWPAKVSDEDEEEKTKDENILWLKHLMSDSGEDEEENTKGETCLVAQASNEICLGINLEPDEWIKR
ncbi:reverse transcriptase domain-containing protein [Tanacetum coccineum]|uniref:Reverse transcriptase domain-containing protein n=1 Tax=Tanacetum coccineum TaxID=301880 RepID=A0ABQ5IFP2_9ASTR